MSDGYACIRNVPVYYLFDFGERGYAVADDERLAIAAHFEIDCLGKDFTAEGA